MNAGIVNKKDGDGQEFWMVRTTLPFRILARLPFRIADHSRVVGLLLTTSVKSHNT